MKVSELLTRRRENWQELERLCDELGSSRRRRVAGAERVRFAALYRSACADLALADSYQLPPNTVQYLHRLVGRAHNQLYRSRRFDVDGWGRTLLNDVPQAVFNDRCVQLMFFVFWAVFMLSAFFSYDRDVWPNFAQDIVTERGIERMERDFEFPLSSSPDGPARAAWYIQHNTTIGLQCFVGGLLVVPGFYVMIFNAAFLGGSFGYMARPGVLGSENFFEFVTAHAPFELTAIVLSGGAGLRLGYSWIRTRGMSRMASLRKTANEAMPIMGSAMMLFFLAALIEGFLSPSGAPHWLKQSVAVLSSGMLMFYFLILGYPRRSILAA